MIDDIKNQVEKLGAVVEQEKGKVDYMKETIKDGEKKLEEEKEKYRIQCEVLDLLRKYAGLEEDKLRDKIDSVITKGLDAIFVDEDIESELQFDIKRGQAVAEPKIVTGGQAVNPEKADSGGVANLIGFLYNLLVLAKTTSQRQIIVADEPFKNLSNEYIEATGEFIKMLSDKLNIQIVLLTHQDGLKNIGDKIYETRKVKNESRFNEIQGR